MVVGYADGRHGRGDACRWQGAADVRLRADGLRLRAHRKLPHVFAGGRSAPVSEADAGCRFAT